MSLRVGGHSGPMVGEIKGIEIHGGSGVGTYLLYLRLNVVVNNLNGKAILNQLSCRLESGGQSVAQGFFEGAPVVEWSQYTSDAYLGFNFHLTGSQLNGLELLRHDNDLGFGVWLSGICHYEGKADSFSDRGEFNVLKQEWLRALGQMNYKKTLLFELEMPSANILGEQVISLLEKAQSHILNGTFEEAVASCRKVIELVETQRGDKADAASAANSYKNNRREMTVCQRMLFLREALKNITHLANHANEDSFSRYQAQSVLGMTVALLSSPEVGCGK